jgi:hypothetical protein
LLLKNAKPDGRLIRRNGDLGFAVDNENRDRWILLRRNLRLKRHPAEQEKCEHNCCMPDAMEHKPPEVVIMLTSTLHSGHRAALAGGCLLSGASAEFAVFPRGEGLSLGPHSPAARWTETDQIDAMNSAFRHDRSLLLIPFGAV